MKLCELDSGLNKIHVWSVESAPAVIQRIQQDETNPEIKARGIGEVQDELQKRRNSLERITQDLQCFEKGKKKFFIFSLLSYNLLGLSK